jgi:hypothetical protein
VLAGHRVGVQAHPRRGAGRQVLHQHVGTVQQLVHHASALGLLEVKGQRLLTAVEPHEVARLAMHGTVVTPGEVAALGTLDLDHPRTQVGELSGGVRRGPRLLQAHDGDAPSGAAVISQLL